MNKKVAAILLSAVLGVSLLSVTAFAYTDETEGQQETGVIVREIPAEEVDESETENSNGTVGTDSSRSSLINEDGSVTQSSSTTSGTGSESGSTGTAGIEELLSSLSEGTTTTTEEKKIGTVTTDGSYLNVRSGEGLDYGVIDTLNNGDTVEVLEDHGDWLYVAIPEHTGYVCADYMDVRTVPGSSGQRIAFHFPRPGTDPGNAGAGGRKWH